MEDILASIRRIIAEEPPGSRSLPPLTRADTPAPTPSFGRAFALREPQFSAPAPEPYLRPSPQAYNDTAYPTARTEPKFEPLPAPSKSVDAQLSDLLNDDAGPASNGAAAKPVVSDADSDFVSMHMSESGAPATGTSGTSDFAADADDPGTDDDDEQFEDDRFDPSSRNSAPNVRPGFTVSRDGYVPGSKSQALANDADAGDPFDFDLGPSPFKMRGKANTASSNHPSQVEAEVETEFEPVAETEAPEATALNVDEAKPAADAMTAADQPASAAAVLSAKSEAAPAAQTTASAAAAVRSPLPISEITREVKFVSPSLAATMGPTTYYQPLHQPEISKPAFAERKAAADATPFARPPDTVVALLEPMEAASAGNDRHGNLKSTAPVETTAVFSEPQPRSMEDTVADLLRPMLKSWLAENMPKIVERALRREMTEQTRPEHKAAAE